MGGHLWARGHGQPGGGRARGPRARAAKLLSAALPGRSWAELRADLDSLCTDAVPEPRGIPVCWRSHEKANALGQNPRPCSWHCPQPWGTKKPQAHPHGSARGLTPVSDANALIPANRRAARNGAALPSGPGGRDPAHCWTG